MVLPDDAVLSTRQKCLYLNLRQKKNTLQLNILKHKCTTYNLAQSKSLSNPANFQLSKFNGEAEKHYKHTYVHTE